MQRQVSKRESMSLLATRPVILITTLGEGGLINGGAFGAYTNLSPTEVGIAIGKPSHTYQNIKKTGEFVINVPGADLLEAIHIFGSSLPADVSEVEEAKLTPLPSRKISVPSLSECVAAVECRYEKELEIGYHSFVVGEVQCGWVREEFLDSEGYPDLVKARVLHDIKYPREIYLLFGEVVEYKKESYD